MQVAINGNNQDIPNEVKTIQHLIEHLNLQEKILIVQLNEEILEKSSHHEKTIQDRDRIEIVHFVGGG